jgi:hypothetical protein
MAEIDRRKSERFCLEAPVLIEFVNEGGEAVKHECTTRDINVDGAFFVTKELVQIGQKFTAKIKFEFKYKDGTKGTLLTTNGVVVRKNNNGVGAKFEKKYHITGLDLH